MKLLNFILDFIYPPKCILCTKILDLQKEKFFCIDCEDSLVYNDSVKCNICGRVLNSLEEPCTSCEKKNYYFEKNYSVFTYDELISTLIKNFKYRNHPSYAKGIGFLMSDFYKENIFEQIDFLVPVPVHYKRKISRGFNQAELLALEISKYTNIKVLPDLLIRHVNTKPQSNLSSEDRKINLNDAFSINKKFNKKFEISNKNILVIDDIYTTGTTINSCCKILKSEGAGKIYSFCFAITTNKN